MVRNSLSNFIMFTVAILWAFCLIESQIQVRQKPSTFSSARTTKHFPSLRCASAIRIVRWWKRRWDAATTMSYALPFGRLCMRTKRSQ